MFARSTSRASAFGAITLVIVAATLPAQAREVETGAVTICDTEKQAERFVALFSGNAQTAIKAVNAEENNPTACVIANVAYVRGPAIGTARNRTHAFEIIPIVVIGVSTPAGWQQLTPAPFFSLVKVNEYAV